MGHSRFEITEVSVRFDPARLEAMVEAAVDLGYLEDLIQEEVEASGLPPGQYELGELLSELFSAHYELSDDLVLTEAEFEWWDGERSPEGAICTIFATAAKAGSFLTFLDFDDYTRDVYDIVFDGQGGHERETWVSDGIPVRVPPRASA